MKKRIYCLMIIVTMIALILTGCEKEGNRNEDNAISQSSEKINNTENIQNTQIEQESEIMCEHEYLNATCLEPAICTKCGEKYGDAVGHDYIVATCTEPEICSVCGVSQGNAAGHKYMEATCVEPPKCTVCGIVNGTALGHDMTEADCTNESICKRCGKKVGGANGHDYMAATCTNPEICSVCGKKKGAPIGHKYTVATCTERSKCNICGDIKGDARGHKYTEATCTEVSKCKVCGLSNGRELGHDYVDGLVCSRCMKENPNNICLNFEEITMYGGYEVWSGIEYVGQDYTDRSQYWVKLHLYGIENVDDIVWKSENTDVAIVDEEGKVTPVNWGTTYVSANIDGKTYRCKVNVNEIRVYFMREYTDSTIPNNCRWIWNGSYCGLRDYTLKYKILERQYDEKGRFIRECDITTKLNIKPDVNGTFEVKPEAGTIKILVGETSQFDLTSNIRTDLNEYSIYGKDSLKSVQQIILKIYADEKGKFKEFLATEGYRRMTLGEIGEFKVGPGGRFTCTFSHDDVSIAQPDWYFYTAPPSEFTWESKDESVAKVKTILGSAEGYYNKAYIETVGCGKTTIVVKYLDYVIGEIEIDVK